MPLQMRCMCCKEWGKYKVVFNTIICYNAQTNLEVWRVQS